MNALIEYTECTYKLQVVRFKVIAILSQHEKQVLRNVVHV